MTNSSNKIKGVLLTPLKTIDVVGGDVIHVMIIILTGGFRNRLSGYIGTISQPVVNS